MAGGVWNTMPPHTHHRRSEVYLYFGLAADAMVVHLMGEPRETRHLIVRDSEVVHTIKPNAGKYGGTWTDPQPAAGPHYYYIRVLQTDNEIAWASYRTGDG